MTKEFKCFCGEDRELTHKTVSNTYEYIKIDVHNVPVYICNNGHVKMTRIVRYSLRHLLEKARTLKETEITYEEYKI